MAERRMFSKKIIDSDAFLDMPLSTQSLYFHFAMRADDDGFINNPKKIQRMIGASDDDCRLLILKRYIITFETGVIVIKHWRIHNYIRRDTYTATLYQEEKNMLHVKEDGAYTDHAIDTILLPCAEPVTETLQPRDEPVDGSLTQDRLGKDRLDKDSTGKSEGGASRPAHKHGEYGWVKLTDAQYSKLIKDFGKEETERLITYIDESAQSNHNKNKWHDWNCVIRKAHRQGWGSGYGNRTTGRDKTGAQETLKTLMEEEQHESK